jgi:hypothetical protein
MSAILYSIYNSSLLLSYISLFVAFKSFSTISVKVNMCRLLIGKPEGNRPLGRPRRRWVHNIRMDIIEIGLDGVAQDRDKWKALVNAVMNLRVL